MSTTTDDLVSMEEAQTSQNQPQQQTTVQSVEEVINREWILSPEGKKFRKEMFSGGKKSANGVSPIVPPTERRTGILEEPFVPPSIMAEVRESKIVFFGRTAVGKTSLIANLCSMEVPSSHVETSGIQVIGCFWPVQIRASNRILIMKYKMWDCGHSQYKKYNYLAEALSSFEPKVFVFVFSITDKDSFLEVDRQISLFNENAETRQIIKIAVGTKNDYCFQSQISRQEFAEFSEKHNVPLYFVKNLKNPPTNDALQNEKDIMKIKNDLAEFILSGPEYYKKVKIFKNESRFRVRDRKSDTIITSPMRGYPRITTSQVDLFELNSDHNSSFTDDETFGLPATPIIPLATARDKVSPLHQPTSVSDKSHPSYELVYDMLIGIRNAVVEMYAHRADREEKMNLDYQVEQIVLIPKDFTDAHRYNYKNHGVQDEDGRTSSSEQTYDYTFRFIDYSPFVFANIRSYFGYNSADYLDSLTQQVALCELKSPGKSGSFFYYSLDYKFIIKTITEAEVEHFRSFLKYYYQYMMQNPNTLICKFYGLHMVQPRGFGRELYFVVMDNTFYSEYGILEKYDLKGSTVGRYASEKEKETSDVILKDLDIVMKRKIRLGKEGKQKLMEQLEKDTKLLAENNVMDYSFLVGVTVPDATKLKKPLVDEDKATEDPHKRVSLFKKDHGGIYSRDKDEVYFFCIIDVFQEWNVKKKVENSLKSLIHEANGISAVHPALYRERFLKFLSEIME